MYSRPSLFLIAVFVAGVAILFTQPWNTSRVEGKKYVQGRNNTVLLLSNDDFGLGNVILATSSALLAEYPDLELHFGTYKKFVKPIERINQFTASSTSSNTIRTHVIEGVGFSEAITSRYSVLDNVVHQPGRAGYAKFLSFILHCLQPLEVSDYMRNYHEIIELIEKVDPAVVVIEPLFSPAADAVRATNRQHVFVSPNALRDVLAGKQPWLAALWKYPAMGSAIRYPVPLSQIPLNVYLNLGIAYKVLTDRRLSDIQAGLRESGIEKPYNLLDAFTEDTPWVSMGSLDTDFPLRVIPDNAVACGPIYLASASVEEQDSELASWLKQAPTILINLGSHTDYRESDTDAIVQALRFVFDTTSNQVLWKFKKRVNYTDEVFDIVSDEIINGRLRLVDWISADPSALLESGRISLSVNHGGSNLFHEAVAAGVPQILLPMWADCYDYAIRAEYLNIGIYGNSRTAPDFSSQELKEAFSIVLGQGGQGNHIRDSATKLGKARQKSPGRSCAAREVAKLAILPTKASEDT